MRNVFRPVLALGVALTMLGSSGMAFARGRDFHGQGGPQGRGFSDLHGFQWAMPGITALQNQGVLQGVAPGTFDPSGFLTRAEMAAVLGRLLGWQAGQVQGQLQFGDDNQIPSYALPYVGVAYRQGILQGFPGGMFLPGGHITWAQLAVIAARALNYPQVPADQVAALLTQLPNGAQTPEWAAEAVAQDIQAGDFTGALADMYQPQQHVTRAQLAAFLLQAEQHGAVPGTTAGQSLQNVLSGQVTSISGATLALQTAGGSQSVTVASTASVYVGPTPSSLSAVQDGDTVTAILSGGEATFIDITAGPTAPAATGATSTLTGTVDSVTGTEIELTLTGLPPLYLPVASNVTVYENGGQTGTGLQAVQPGQTVTVGLDGSGQVLTIDIGGSTGLGTGTLAVATTSLPGAVLDQGYAYTLTATGGSGAGYTWTYSGTLPTGLTLASDGTLSGTPSAPGTWSFEVVVRDSANNSAAATLSLTVAPSGSTTSGLAVTTTSLPGAVLNDGYAYTLSATGGSGSGYTWTYSGTLPTGLTLASDGTLSGTPSAPGTWSFEVVVRDSANDTAAATLSLTVGTTGSTTSGLAVTTTSLPGAVLNDGYAYTLAATGGSGTGYTWTYSGTLPPGLSLASDGVLSGTPSATGTWSFEAVVRDSAGNTAAATVSLTVGTTGSTTSGLAVTTTSLPAGTYLQPYYALLTAGGGSGNYSWTWSGQLVPGLSIGTANGVIGGMPSSAGTYTFDVQVHDNGTGQTSNAQALTIVVNQ